VICDKLVEFSLEDGHRPKSMKKGTCSWIFKFWIH